MLRYMIVYVKPLSVSVNELLDHDMLWFNTLIRPSHESPVVYFFQPIASARLPDCQWKQVVRS